MKRFVQGSARRRLPCLALSLVVLSLAGCGGGGQTTAPATSPPAAGGPRTLPVVAGSPISPGDYVTRFFQPPTSLSLTDGWKLNRESSLLLAISRVDDEKSTVELYALQEQPETASASVAIRTMRSRALDPNLIIKEFHLKPTKPEPVTLGGGEGLQFECATASLLDPESAPECFPIRCYLFTSSFGTGHRAGFFPEPDTKTRMIAVDVGEKTFAIAISAPVEKFDAFLTQAEEVLDTVKFNA